MTINASHPLLTLLPTTAYLLAYAIPLLVVSVVLTFAGAFLILDRTRSFIPQYDALPGAYQRTKKLVFPLEGGVGGIAIGYAFGLHLATFLSLLVPAVSTKAPLSSGAFVAVWVLSSLPTMVAAARWKYAALLFAGITGGTLFALGLSVIIHPSLLTRIILIAIIAGIMTIATPLPLPRFHHSILRFATSSAGAGGICIAIGLLADIPAWANVWERLWVANGDTWNTSQVYGLSAGFALFVFFGFLSDWFLKRTFGECPDEKWDSYLANYTTNLPGRAGVYQPFVPLWARIFGGGAAEHSTKDILFPPGDGDDIKLPPFSPFSPHSKFSPGKLTPDEEDSYFERRRDLLTKKKSRHGKKKRGREGVRFRPLGDTTSDSDSDEDLIMAMDAAKRPWLKQLPSMTSTAPTLVGKDSDAGDVGKDGVILLAKDVAEDGKDVVEAIDYEKEIKKLAELKSKKITAGLGDGEIPDYSDHEDGDLATPKRTTFAVTTPTKRPTSNSNSNSKSDGKGEKWSPGFMKNKTARGPSYGSQSTATAVESNPPSSRQPLDNSLSFANMFSSSLPASSLTPPFPTSSLSPPLGAVPATPSLIKALDRLAVAQKDAFESPSRTMLVSPTSPTTPGKTVGRTSFGGDRPSPTEAKSSPTAAKASPTAAKSTAPKSAATTVKTKEKEEPKPGGWDDFWRDVKKARSGKDS